MKQHIISLILGTALLAGCANFLEPLPNGSYNEKNYADYPALVRGYVEKAYDLRPGGYISSEYLGTIRPSTTATSSSRTTSA